MNAWIFPGQGSQKVGMGRAWAEAFPFARARFETASQVLGYDLAALCFDGPEEKLTDTRHAQPALLTVGVIASDIARERGLECNMVAGHSLGEYAALVAADVLGFEDALRLVQQRAELMSHAPPGAMAAIIGLEMDKRLLLLEAARSNGVGDDNKLLLLLEAAREHGPLVVANDNSPGQVVVSGAVEAVEFTVREAKKFGAKMAIRLPVSGAFHSPLMEAAGEKMGALIDAAEFREPRVPVFPNTMAMSTTKAQVIKGALRVQMVAPVRWRESVLAMIADGATQFTELGPGKVLCGLSTRIDKSVPCEAAESWDLGGSST